MKNSIILLFSAVLCSILSYSQTVVNGANINTDSSWTKEFSPFMVTANILISEGASLTIEPGVEVFFDDATGIAVRGSFRVNGSSNDSVFIGGMNGVEWQGLSLDLSKDSYVELNYLKESDANNFINFTGFSSKLDTIIKIKNSWLSNNGQVIVGDDRHSNVVVLHNSKFTNQEAYVYVYSGNCIVDSCVFDGGRRGFYNNDSQNSTIISNSIFSNFTDIALSVRGSVTNSEFFNNEIAITTMGPGPFMRFNDIHDNEVGIDLWTPIRSNSPDQIQENKICNNTYGVYLRHNSDGFVPNNCWCETDPAIISEMIWDVYDNINLGEVHFYPYVDTCTATSTSIAKNTSEIDFQLYPNPAQNVLNISYSAKYAKPNSLVIMDNLGRIFHPQIKTVSNKNILELSIKELPAGIYSLQFSFNGSAITRRFIRD